jgi:hypothetical protein
MDAEGGGAASGEGSAEGGGAASGEGSAEGGGAASGEGSAEGGGAASGEGSAEGGGEAGAVSDVRDPRRLNPMQQMDTVYNFYRQMGEGLQILRGSIEQASMVAERNQLSEDIRKKKEELKVLNDKVLETQTDLSTVHKKRDTIKQNLVECCLHSERMEQTNLRLTELNRKKADDFKNTQNDLRGIKGELEQAKVEKRKLEDEKIALGRDVERQKKLTTDLESELRKQSELTAAMEKESNELKIKTRAADEVRSRFIAATKDRDFEKQRYEALRQLLEAERNQLCNPAPMLSASQSIESIISGAAVRLSRTSDTVADPVSLVSPPSDVFSGAAGAAGPSSGAPPGAPPGAAGPSSGAPPGAPPGSAGPSSGAPPGAPPGAAGPS